eukprot:5831278-Pleurochrysis_carterae.AAC.1
MGRIELDEVAQLGMRAKTFAFCVSFKQSVVLVCLVNQHVASDEFSARVEKAKGDDQFMVAWMGTYDAKNRLSRIIVTAPWASRCNHHATSRSKTHKYAD